MLRGLYETVISDSLLLITWPVKLFPLLIQADWLDMALLSRRDLGYDARTRNHLGLRIFLCFLFLIAQFSIPVVS